MLVDFAAEIGLTSDVIFDIAHGAGLKGDLVGEGRKKATRIISATHQTRAGNGEIQLSKEKIEVIHGSGKIWRDLDYPDADVRQAKGILAARVVGILNDRNLSIRKAQKLSGFAAADFSRIRNADYGRFTIDRLIRMLEALDSTVEVAITIRIRPQEDVSAPQA